VVGAFDAGAITSVGNELSKKVLNYAERNVHNAFVFAHKFVQVKDVQDLVKLQTEFIQCRWRR